VSDSVLKVISWKFTVARSRQEVSLICGTRVFID